MNPRHYMIDIVFAGAQIFIIHVFEDLHNPVTLDFQRPFCVAALTANDFQWRFRQQRVIQHQQMGIDKSGDIGRGGGRNTLPDSTQFGPSQLQPGAVAFDFCVDLLGLQFVLDNFSLRPLQAINPPDRVAS